jgi:hypothetical protein
LRDAEGQDFARRCFGCIACQVDTATFIFAENRNLKHPHGIKEIAGENWFSTSWRGIWGFSLRNPEGLSKVWTEGMNRNFIEMFLVLVREVTEELGIVQQA